MCKYEKVNNALAGNTEEILVNQTIVENYGCQMWRLNAPINDKRVHFRIHLGKNVTRLHQKDTKISHLSHLYMVQICTECIFYRSKPLILDKLPTECTYHGKTVLIHPRSYHQIPPISQSDIVL